MRAVRVPCIRLWQVSGQVWDAHTARPRERTEQRDLENFSPSRSARVGPHCSGYIMSRDCGPGIIADSCTHEEL